MASSQEQTELRTHDASEPGEGEQETVTVLEPEPAPRPQPASAPAEAFAKGDMLDHFVVAGTLGAGAMGVVFDAYDPDLDRRVAIKVVRSGRDRRESTRARMLREAQSMARVSHRNVVTVHEVGLAEGRVYIAMELVDGSNLRQWMQAEPRSLEQILRVCVDAGQGLCAAHRAGLVHRDFKPDNVLVSHEGRVAVTDFGLVAIHQVEQSEATAPASDVSVGPFHATLTESGSMLGTPAYMAPEQHRHDSVDPRADQFAFCVVLWEALYGQRPFEGKTLAQLAGNVLDGRRDAPALRTVHGDRVPRRVRQALERGLSTQPDARWSAMEPLLHALEPRRVDARPWIATAAVLGGGAVAVWSVWPDVQDAASVCMEQRGIDDVWSDARRGAIEAGFEQTGRAYAQDAFERVSGRLDRWAAAWNEARADACRSTHVQHDQSDVALDLRMACLQRHLAGVDALVTTLGEPLDDATLAKVVGAAAKLPEIDECSDVPRLVAGRDALLDGDHRDRVDALAADLGAVMVQSNLGRYQAAKDALLPVIERARALGEPGILADALRRGGELDVRLGAAAEAEPMLHEAVQLAVDGQRPEVEAEAWRWLVFVVGTSLVQTERAKGLIVAAEVALRRVDRPRLHARFHNTVSQVHSSAGELEDAEREITRAVELASGLEGDPIELAMLLVTAGSVVSDRGRHDEGKRYYEQALHTFEHELGPQHPTVAVVYSNLGLLIQQSGDLQGARERYQRSYEIWTQAFGEQHPHVAVAHENLGVIAQSLGDLELAREHYERSLEIRRVVHGDSHPSLGSTYSNLGIVAMLGARYEQAAEHLETAGRLWRAAYGEEHPSLADLELNLGVLHTQTRDFERAHHHLEIALDLAQRVQGPQTLGTMRALSNLANVERQQGRCAAAIPRWEQAQKILEGGAGLDSSDGAYVLGGLGWCALESDRHEDAERLLRRAVEIRAPQQLEPDVLARERYGLAQALWALERTDEAIEQATQAVALLEGRTADRDVSQSKEIEGWIDSLPGRGP